MMPEISVSIDPDDNEVLSVYIRLTENKVSKTVEMGPECNVDLDSRGRVIGVEMIAPCNINIINKAAKKYNAPLLKQVAPRVEKLCA